MNLRTLIQGLGLTLATGRDSIEISDVADDSRQASPGCLFVARDTGDERWRSYVDTAIERGAAAIVAPQAVEVPEGVALAVGSQNTPGRIDQQMAGWLAGRFFGEPAKQLQLLGVTGTNGKTTVATLTQYLLNTAGVKCGLLGTTAIDVGSDAGPQPAQLTTPGAIELHRHFAAMVAHGCKACAMEVSSHALDQGRVEGLSFQAAVFTNLTQDHLDYHGTMEAYGQAKAKLFRQITPGGRAVLPRDDSAAQAMLQEIGTSVVVVWTTADPAAAWGQDYQLIASRLSSTASDIHFTGGNRPGFDARLPLIGEHNLRNLVQAIAAAESIEKIPDATLKQAIESCPPVPGRLEPVVLEDAKTPSVLVDYAHTPDALENVLGAMRPLTPRLGRLIVVFGCGGDRDRAKRPIMAKIASEGADAAVLTSDNPRTEDPQQILDDALAGVAENLRGRVSVEIDRAKAIESAILGAQASDTVLIAGKGHEDYQVIGTTKIHFDDREHAAVALRAWAARSSARLRGVRHE